MNKKIVRTFWAVGILAAILIWVGNGLMPLY